jgi:hypothetical protein
MDGALAVAEQVSVHQSEKNAGPGKQSESSETNGVFVYLLACFF